MLGHKPLVPRQVEPFPMLTGIRRAITSLVAEQIEDTRFNRSGAKRRDQTACRLWQPIGNHLPGLPFRFPIDERFSSAWMVRCLRAGGCRDQDRLRGGGIDRHAIEVVMLQPFIWIPPGFPAIQALLIALASSQKAVTCCRIE